MGIVYVYWHHLFYLLHNKFKVGLYYVECTNKRDFKKGIKNGLTMTWNNVVSVWIDTFVRHQFWCFKNGWQCGQSCYFWCTSKYTLFKSIIIIVIIIIIIIIILIIITTIIASSKYWVKAKRSCLRWGLNCGYV